MTHKERLARRPAGQKVVGTWVSLPARRVAQAVKDGPLFVDGAPGPAGEGARGVSFSPDGAHLAYYLKRGAEGHLVVDGELRASFTGFGMLAPVWSAEGRTAFSARRGEEWWIVVDGEARFGPFTDDQPGFGFGKSKLVWTPRGLAYVAVRGDDKRLELEGEPLGEAFTLVRDPIFAPGGAHAYRARRDDQWWVVWNGTALGPFEDCDELVFAPDGRLFFVAGDDETARLYVDNVVVEEHPAIHDLAVAAGAYALIVDDAAGDRRVVHAGKTSAAYANLLGLALTPDGAHTVAVADKGGRVHMLKDGEVIGSAASIPHHSTALSSDGAHVAFLAQGGQSSHVQIDDDVQSEPFDALWSDLAFADDDKTVAFMAEQGEDMFLFTLEAAATTTRAAPPAPPDAGSDHAAPASPKKAAAKKKHAEDAEGSGPKSAAPRKTARKKPVKE